MYYVTITSPAERDTHANYAWWARKHSETQAANWLTGVYAAMHSLSAMPERCSYATEPDLRARGIRQMLYGIVRKNTHRIVFSVDGDRVIIYRVLNVRQGEMEAGDPT